VKIQNLISLMELQGGWVDCGQGFQGIEGEVSLSGWGRKRRVIIARRLVKKENLEATKNAKPVLTHYGVSPVESKSPEYIVLASTIHYGVDALVCLYRERGGPENPFDELKNQWGWAGFTTQDIDQWQVTARLVAQIYNWWSLYARCGYRAILASRYNAPRTSGRGGPPNSARRTNPNQHQPHPWENQ